MYYFLIKCYYLADLWKLRNKVTAYIRNMDTRLERVNTLKFYSPYKFNMNNM